MLWQAFPGPVRCVAGEEKKEDRSGRSQGEERYGFSFRHCVVSKSGGGGERCGAGASESLTLQDNVSKLTSSFEPAKMRLQWTGCARFFRRQSE